MRIPDYLKEKYVILAVIQHPSGMYSAMFFAEDYFRGIVCKSQQLNIVLTIYLLRSSIPDGVYIYGYSDNHCASCNLDDCGDCPRL